MKIRILRLPLFALLTLALLSALIIKLPTASAQKSQSATQATFVVTTADDSGAGSLRQAILDANATSGADTINFAIAGTGPFTISPTSELPAITEAVTIDGYTQPGAAANTSCTGTATLQIVISGGGAGDGSNGLTLAAGISTVRGLVINGFNGSGIEIVSGGATGNVVTGNFIGTNAAGTMAVPNATNGIAVSGGANNVIGGAAVGLRNVISGNSGDGISINGGGGASSTVINGNFIGTNAAGTADLGNSSDGVDISNSPDNRVGGSAATLGCAPGNIISGNNEDGVNISGSSTGNFVRGNLIGTDVTGNVDLGNTAQGVYIFANGNGVGGASAMARNIISGNDGGGINIGGGSVNAVEGNYIGTNLAGTALLRNSEGVRLDTSANNNQIGSGTTDFPFYATTNTNALVRFNEAGTLQTVGTITNLQTNEVIEGIDFRPLNNQLYALGVTGTTGRLYRVNKQTAAATQVGAPFTLNGSFYGFDFNPTVDRIRLVTSGGQNLRLNPNNAAVTVDGAINGATTAADAAAYTNSFAGATATVLYDINQATDTLYIQSNPNGGTTTTVGALGVDSTGVGGFDIRASDNRAYAALTVGTATGLYTVNLNSGAATFVSALGNNQIFRTFAIAVTSPAQANIISGNDVGVNIVEGFNNAVRGNLIGTNSTGADLGNLEAGVYIQQPSAMNNIIGGTGVGDGNTISFNGNGVTAQPLFGEGGVVVFAGAINNRILGNGINDNTGLGIDLGSTGPNAVTMNDPLDVDSGDGNNYQNFPTVSAATTNAAGIATTVSGTLSSAASRVYRLEFFSVPTADASGNGEGAVYRGTVNVTTDATGMASYTSTLASAVSGGQLITATATDQASGDTSEFSATRAVTGPMVAQGIESDVQPRPNGDNVVDADDIQEIRRFSVGLDMPYQSNEFQRADASSRSTAGDGFLDADDVQQARRYSVGTDTNQSAAGPTTQSRSTTAGKSGSAMSLSQVLGTNERSAMDAIISKSLPNAAKTRGLRINGAKATISGQTITVPILVDAAGDEAGYTFTLNYNSSVLGKPVVSIGEAGGDVVYNANSRGQIGFSITSFSGGKIAAGANQRLISVTFSFAANGRALTTPLIFSSSLARQKTAGVDPNTPLEQPVYTDGAISLGGSGKIR